eukprot:TRINITY_DN30945_c0_g1_i1.p1 TRINITY_DN30945_c0_g1~~TRINITY_DN30945_c0_g1_i1.p1  ORF type:complete len:535 (+),score=72.72 TRINITY_DN30945_c0_g1_i1:82-1686(+)
MAHRVVCIGRDVVDNGHQAGHVEDTYYIGTSHRDGISRLGVTGVELAGVVLFPASILHPFANGSNAVTEGQKCEMRINNTLFTVFVTAIKPIHQLKPRGWLRQTTSTNRSEPAEFSNHRLQAYWKKGHSEPHEAQHLVLPQISWAVGRVLSPVEKRCSIDPLYRNDSLHRSYDPVPSVSAKPSERTLRSFPYNSTTNIIGLVDLPIPDNEISTYDLPGLFLIRDTKTHPCTEGGACFLGSNIAGLILPPVGLEYPAEECHTAIIDLGWMLCHFGLPVRSDVVPMLRQIRIRNPVKPSMDISSVVKIQQGASWGSGILLKANKIVSNAHVVEDSRFVTVDGKDAGKVLFKSKGSLDLALIEADSVSQPSPMGTATEGDVVYSVGFSNGSGQVRPAIHAGYVLKVFPSCIITSAETIPGSSGGALFNSKGEVVGMLTSCFYDICLGKIVPSIGMAIPTTLLGPLLNQPLSQASLNYNNQDRVINNIWSLAQSDGTSDALQQLSLQIQAAKSGDPVLPLPDGSPGSMLSNYILKAKL